MKKVQQECTINLHGVPSLALFWQLTRRTVTPHVHHHGSKKDKETLPSKFPQPSVHWMPHQSRSHQCRAAGDCPPELSPQKVWQCITHPSSLPPPYDVYQDSHGSSSAIQCKDVHQRHFMDGGAIAHPCKSKYFILFQQLSLV